MKNRNPQGLRSCFLCSIPKQILFAVYALLAFSISSNSILAQSSAPNAADFSKINDVLPPSPNAASLGKFGDIEPALSTGTINIKIPIWTFTSTNISLPISLSYSSNGFKVDEVAGRAGVGWSINAGGVITRTVYGSVDENSTREPLPANFPAMSRGLIDYMNNISSGEASGPDGQPDIFSFNLNGISGKFILDANLNPVLTDYSNVKIERNFVSDDWNFKITTADGVQYLFGGNTARERTKRQSAGAGCGRNYNTFIPTAWYLKKIIHPNNDEVNFLYTNTFMTYSSGLQETIYSRDNTQNPPSCAGFEIPIPNMQNTICENILQTEGVLLTEINSASSGKIILSYNSRNDIDDHLLSRIEVYQAGQGVSIRNFIFTYQYGIASSFKNTFSNGDIKLTYWPFLTRLTEQSADATIDRFHAFNYNSINSLPPRLSFSQDHFGYFNGKNNATLIPVPKTTIWQTKFPQATANRDTDANFAKNGLLSLVTYPTGGKDSIIYESNQVYESVSTYPPQTNVNISATNLTFQGGAGTTNFSSNATISYNQEVILSGQCISNSTTGGDPIHDQSTISLIDASNNVLFSSTIFPGQSFSEIVNVTSPLTIRVRVNSNGENVTGSGTLFFSPGTVNTQYANVNTGGVRVQKIQSYDGIHDIPTTNIYIYSNLSNQSISSGSPTFVKPIYEKYLGVLIPCASGEPKDPSNPTSQINCDVREYKYYSMYSSSLNNIYVYSSGPVSYTDVVESHGEEFENGGIEHKYLAESDQSSYPLIGNTIFLGGPTSSFAWRNGREIYQNVFKKSGQNYLPVKKTFYHYKEDTRVDTEIKGYFANKKYTPYCENPGTFPHVAEQNAYDLATYTIYRKWIYLDSVKTWTYNTTGDSYLEQIEITEYGNAAHALATKQISNQSDGSTNTITTIYPQDITLSGAEETARQDMIAKYMIGNIVKQQIHKNATQLLFDFKTSYNTFSNGLTLTSGKSVQKASGPMEERVKFFSYGNTGKIVEQAKTDDVRQAYIWDYHEMYPIAQATNASLSDIAYTSFEADGKGNWNYSGSPTDDASAKTGKKVFTIVGSTNNITKTGLSSAKTYIVTYWKKGGSITVNGTSGDIISTNNGWTFYEHVISNPINGTITVTGSNGVIDELRLYPSYAQMVTNTWEPLIGTTSQSDPSGKTTYFEYDGLGRLKIVRDEDKNILKMMEYKYYTPITP